MNILASNGVYHIQQAQPYTMDKHVQQVILMQVSCVSTYTVTLEGFIPVKYLLQLEKQLNHYVRRYTLNDKEAGIRSLLLMFRLIV